MDQDAQARLLEAVRQQIELEEGDVSNAVL